MGIFKRKGGYAVKSYNTGKYHRDNQGGIKIYSTKKKAMKSAGKNDS